MASIPGTIYERLPLPGAAPVARPMAPAGGAAAISAGDVLRIIKQRIFLIIFLWILFIGITVGGTILQLKYFPQWRAEALIQLDAEMPTGINEQATRFAPNEYMSRFLLTESARVKSQAVLQEALLDADVQRTGWYQSVEKELRVKELEESLRVGPLEGTNLLRVAMGCKKQDDPHRIVNAVVKSYLNSAAELARNKFRDRVREFQQEESRVEKQLQTKIDEIERLSQNMTVPGAVSGVNVVADQLRRLAEDLAALQNIKFELKSLYETYEAAGAQGIAVSPQTTQLVESDPAVAGATSRVQALEEELMVALENYGRNHRLVQQIEQRLLSLRGSLENLRDLRLDEVRDFQINQARVAFFNIVDQEGSMLEKYQELLAQQRDIDAQLAQYTKMESEKLVLQDKYNQIREIRSNLQFMLGSQSTLQMSQAAAAVAPLEISSPKLVLNIAIGTFLGLLLSLGIALAVELVNTRIRTPGDLSRHLHLSILGTVPDIDDEEIVIERVETAVIDAPHSMVAEAFRQIRTNLFFAAPAERQRTLLLTSPSSEDGKTSVAINLAASLASTGRRVLLVDANLRRPALHRIFAGSNEHGLSHVLIGQARWQNLVGKTPLGNLDYLAAGPTPPNPAELLGGSYMRTFLAEAAAEYDQVLIDGPPVLLVSDAAVISALVDGAVLVLRARTNSRGVAARSRDLLLRVNAHILGAVLNAAQAQRGGYFREQLRNFYEYQQESLEAERDRRALPKGKEKPKKRKGRGKDRDLADDEAGDEPESSASAGAADKPDGDDSPN